MPEARAETDGAKDGAKDGAAAEEEEEEEVEEEEGAWVTVRTAVDASSGALVTVRLDPCPVADPRAAAAAARRDAAAVRQMDMPMPRYRRARETLRLRLLQQRLAQEHDAERRQLLGGPWTGADVDDVATPATALGLAAMAAPLPAPAHAREAAELLKVREGQAAASAERREAEAKEADDADSEDDGGGVAQDGLGESGEGASAGNNSGVDPELARWVLGWADGAGRVGRVVVVQFPDGRVLVRHGDGTLIACEPGSFTPAQKSSLERLFAAAAAGSTAQLPAEVGDHPTGDSAPAAAPAPAPPLPWTKLPVGLAMAAGAGGAPRPRRVVVASPGSMATLELNPAYHEAAMRHAAGLPVKLAGSGMQTRLTVCTPDNAVVSADYDPSVTARVPARVRLLRRDGARMTLLSTGRLTFRPADAPGVPEEEAEAAAAAAAAAGAASPVASQLQGRAAAEAQPSSEAAAGVYAFALGTGEMEMLDAEQSFFAVGPHGETVVDVAGAALASASPTRRAGHSGNTVLGSSQRRWASGQSSRPVKGMRDLHGEDMASLAAVRAAFWDTVGLYGFEEWQTPILESSGVFTGSLGADSDVVAKEMFRFSTLGGEDVCMRPEGTAAIMRAAVRAGMAASGRAVRAAYLGPMFRYERPQRGRYRQFTQCGVELLGDPSVEADAEAIAAALDFLREAGVPPSGSRLELQLNSLGDDESRRSHAAALTAYLERHRSELSAESVARLNRGSCLRVLDSKHPGDQAVAASAPRTLDHLSAASGARHARLEALLERLGVDCVVPAPSLVRGLDYYKECVFEAVLRPTELGEGPCGDGSAGDWAGAAPAADAEAAGLAASRVGTVLAGGRYDGLTQRFGAPSLPGIGWAAGADRVALLGGTRANVHQWRPSVAVLVLGDGEAQGSAACGAAAVARQALKAAGAAAGSSVSLQAGTGTKVGARLAAAARAGATHAIIVGEDEVREGSIVVRHLASRAQQRVETTAAAIGAALLHVGSQ
ncbi:hypothetical protein FNF28_04355 [Cafeteria roenbergensis]|uniref:histidine--tRNA ligase n=1 Tax=Cafeteria roenbergensis TaxID=33653 RepID=A0A5A8DCZ9_CAFRO|nr:hypothetical protein FNF28_04355 [Cafeteria roenbergensis]